MFLVFFLGPGFDEGEIEVLLGLCGTDEEAGADFDLHHGDAGFPVSLLILAREELGLGVGELLHEEIRVFPLGDVVLDDVSEHGLSCSRQAVAPKSVCRSFTIRKADLVGFVLLPKFLKVLVIVHVHNKIIFYCPCPCLVLMGIIGDKT